MSTRITFNIAYTTVWGQELRVAFTKGSDYSAKKSYLVLHTYDGKVWHGAVELTEPITISYKYELLNERVIVSEGLDARVVELGGGENVVFDMWRAENHPRNIFYGTALKDVILARGKSKKSTTTKSNATWVLNSPDIPTDKLVGVVGNINALGKWKTPVALSDEAYPNWRLECELHNDVGTIEYKYVLLDKVTKEVTYWEVGPNRTLAIAPLAFDQVIVHDDGFRFAAPWWRGSGVAIPVFSLRSKDSFGIGEFADLKHMVDFTSNLGMNMIQVLPVNDTIAQKTWTDSYPYAAISVYALHPLYIHIPAIANIKKEIWYEEYQNDLNRLNALTQIDFEEVLIAKTKYTQLLYKPNAHKTLKSKAVKDFVAANPWVKSYAVFCHLRDEYGTPAFGEWSKHTVYNEAILTEYWKDSTCTHEGVGYYVFLQYHLDAQLKSARAYGHTKQIALKGDLPIGIYRHSCDAWTNPHLYHMDQQAGAPPDDYAVNGQNWGFPTYNWEEMAKDGFAWWRSRMTQLAVYFDALRIDHILGFFRIWSIPMGQVSGTLGLFYPRMPVSLEELRGFGVKGDLARFTMPYIRTYMLQQLFEGAKKEITEKFLVEVFTDAYVFKPEFATQQQVVAALERPEYRHLQVWSPKLLSLLTEVLLIEEPGSNGLYFNPRITLQTTYSYRDLDDYGKKAFDRLYTEYFYHRHNEFWKNQANNKLPALVNATNMLICGEDLGMIPATVPEVMQSLNIIPLEIQRMPKGDALFGQCKSFDYHTVCSPSCHDMSTIRGWWEGNTQTAMTYYKLYMHGQGEVPRTCDKEIVSYIVADHLASPSMLAIFPIQDLLGMSDELKLANPFAEQINEPANPKHYWRYRLHLNIEDLAKNNEFCEMVRGMVVSYNR